MSSFPDKPHYEILDGLRGVAALIVIIYHVFECFDWTPVPHGYLSVDFFFVLSGFVIGYAYDDRWQKGLTVSGFFRRRLIRLHPMVFMGALIGMVCFFMQGGVRWDGSHVAVSMVMLALLLNMLMIPLPVGIMADVRGNGEMFPLNGPNWSLFFEYVGNILYALFLRRLSTKWLSLLAVLSGGMLAFISVRNGFLGVGWTMGENGLFAGLVRMLFPYSVGMLIARKFRPGKVRHAFWICAMALVGVACLTLLLKMPEWANGFYDALCVIMVFPLLVWVGASDCSSKGATRRISSFLGKLSYPLYAVHYPFMYLFYAYIGFNGNLVPFAKWTQVWPVAVGVVVACIFMGWLTMRFYDLPLRRWLSKTSH